MCFCDFSLVQLKLKMLDPGKRKALVEWINALGVADCFESLRQLQDGVHFCKIIQLVDKDQKFELETAADRLKIVIFFLESHFQVSMIGKIDIALIISRADEFELGKICLLLMCIGIYSESNHLFLEPAMKLENQVQIEIRDMIQSVVGSEVENKGQELDSSFSRVLLKPCNPAMALSMPQMSSTPTAREINSMPDTPIQTNCQFSLARAVSHDTPKFSNSIQASGNSSILSRFYSPQVMSHTPSCMSPVQQLVSSPGMSNKIKLQQKEQRIKRLLRDLNAERHTRSDLEVELQEKDHEITKRDTVIAELQNKLQAINRELVSVHSEIAEQECHVHDDLKQRSVELSKENKELKERNVFLETKYSELSEANNSLREQVDKLAGFRHDCGQYKDTLNQTESFVSELNNALRDKTNMVANLLEANKALENDLRRTQELYQQQQLEWRRTLEISVQNESGECLQEVVEKQLTEQIELLQESLATEHGLKAQLNDHIEQLLKQIECERGSKMEWQKNAKNLGAEMKALTAKFNAEKSEWEARAEILSEELKAAHHSAQAEKGQWQEMSEHLHQEMHKIKEQAQQEHDELEERISNLEDDLNCAREETCDAEKCLEIQMQEKATLHEKIVVMQNQFMEARNNSEMQVGKLQQDICSIRKENKDLVEDVAKEQLLNANLEEEIGNLRNELDAVIETATTQQNSLRSELMKMNETSQHNIQQLDRKYQDELERSRQQIEGLQSSVKMLEELSDSLKSELNVVKQEKEHLDSVVEQEESERTEWLSRCSDMEQELTALKKSSQSKISEFTQSLKEAREKNTQLQNVVQNFHHKMELMETTLRASKEDHDKLTDQLNRKIQDVESERKKLQETVNGYSTKYQNMCVDQEKFAEKVTQMESALRENQAEALMQKQKYEDQLQQEKILVSEENKEKLKIKEELKAIKTENKRLTSELMLVEDTLREKEKMAGDLQATLNDTQLNDTRQRDKLCADLEASRCREQDLEGQLTQAENGLAELKNNLIELQTGLQEAAEELSAAKNNEKDLCLQLSSSNEKFQDLERRLEQSVTNLEQAQTLLHERTAMFEQHLAIERENATQMQDKLDKELRDVNQCLQNLNEEKSLLHKNLKEVESLMSNLKESTQKEHTALKAEIEHTKALAEQKQNELDECHHKEKEFLSQIENEQKRLVDVENNYKQKVSNGEAEVEQLKQQVITTKDQLVVKTREIESLKSDLNSANEMIALKNGSFENLEKQLAVETETFQVTVSKMQQEHSVLQQKCMEAETRLKCMEQNMSEVQQASHMKEDDLLKELISVQHVKRELNARVEIAEGSLEVANKKATELQEQLSKFQKANAVAQEELKQKIKDSYEHCKSVSAELKETTSNAQQMQNLLQNNIEQLKNEKLLQEKHASELKQLLQEQQLKSAESQNRIKQLEDQLKKEIESYQVKISELEKEHVQLQTNMQEQYNKEMETVCEQRSTDQVKLMEAKTQFEAMSKNAEYQEATVKELENQLTAVKEMATKQITQIEEERLSLQSKLQETVSETQEVKAKLSVVDEARNNLEADCINKAQRVTFLENEFDVLRSQLAEKSRELICSLEITKALQDQMQQIDNQSHSFERAMKLAKETSELAREEFKTQVESLVREKDELQKLLSISAEKIQRLESELQELRLRMLKTEGEKQESNSQMFEREKILQGYIDDLKASKEEQQQEMQLFKSRVNSLEEQVTKAGDKVSSLSEEYNAALQRTDSLVTELCNEKQSHAKTRNHLQEELAAARQNRRDLENRIHQTESMHKQTIAQLEHQLNSNRKHAESIQGKLCDAESQLSHSRQQDERIRTLQLQLEQAKSMGANKNSEVQLLHSQIEREVQGHRSRMESMENMYKGQLMQMENAYKQLKDKNEILKDNKEDLKCQLQCLEDKYQQASLHMSEQQKSLQHSAEKEVDRLKRKLNQQQEEYQKQLEKQLDQLRSQLQEDCSHWQQKCEQLTASYHKLKELNRQAESDAIRQKDSADSYRSRCESKSEQLLRLERDVETYCNKIHHLEITRRENDVEITALKTQSYELQVSNKKQAAQIRSMEVQLDHANRQLKGKDDLRKTVSASTVSSSHRETTFDVDNQMMTDARLELGDLQHPHSPARSRHRSRLPRSPSVPARLDDSMLTYDKRTSSTFSLASSNGSVIVDTQSRTFASSLPASGLSHNHRQNKMPQAFRGMFGMNEDEPEQLEFGRLSELQRRNTLCLPHMRSAYPVETQTRDPKQVSDDGLRSGEGKINEEPRSTRKRPSSEGLPLDDSLDGSLKRRTRSQTLDDSLEASAGKRKPLGSYQKPGPPTPGVTPGNTTPRRLRTRNSPSPVISTKKKRQTSRKFTPIRRKNCTNENMDAQGKVHKESMSFNIGFTPKKSRRHISKEQSGESQKKPLAENNRTSKWF